jgi:DNA recombination protein RmuC
MNLTGALLLLAGLVLGLGIGGVVGVLATRAQAAGQASQDAADVAALRVQVETERSAWARLLQAEQEAGSERLGAERAAAAERLELLRAEQSRLAERFEALSAEALRHNSKTFLTLAEERFKTVQQAQAGELEQRRAAVEGLVKPIEEHLRQVASQVEESDRRRAESFSALTEQVRLMGEAGSLLRRETEQLKTALRRPEVRGSWGELQLRQVVELAGMVEYCDFTTQTTLSSDDGRRRPDLIVRMAGGRRVVVDSKVPLDAFADALNATDESVRGDRLAAHARQVRTHVDQLAAKSYWSLVTPSPEFVVMFVPGEAMLAQALETDPALVEHATGKGVLLASPLTLIAMLRTAAYAWKEATLADNAQKVFDEGRGLYKRLSTMGDHLDRLGRALTGSVKAYNQAVGSLERQVLPSARRLADLNVTDETLVTPSPIDEPVRPLAAAELVEAADDARQVRALPPMLFDELEADPRYGVHGGGTTPEADGSAARHAGEGA